MSLATEVLQSEHHLASHQDDAAKRRRLRWRSRRGLLENDLVLGRFFDVYETKLSDADVTGLDELLDLSDNDLLDLIFRRPTTDKEPGLNAEALRVLEILRNI